jgi:uncharacterized membrane protein YeiH
VIALHLTALHLIALHRLTLEDPYLGLQLLGTVAFAVSGAAVAVRAGLDWLGVAVLATITAIGGGTLRDLLLGRLPVTWVQDPWPVWVALGTAVVIIAEAYWHPRQAPDSLRLVLWADAAGLAVFTATGTELALASGISGPVAVLLGVLTGTGGGVARDVLARQRPLVLAGQIYALSAVAGAAVLVLLTDSGAPYEAARWAGVAVALVLRLLAIRYSWALPPIPGTPHRPIGPADEAKPGSDRPEGS